MAIPDGVTFDQLTAISVRAAEIRADLHLPDPSGTFEQCAEIDATLVSMFYNKNHDARGRFASGPGNGGSVSGAKGRMGRSTPEERKAAKAARTEELVAKWGEDFRPDVDKMLAWMKDYTPAEADARRAKIAEAVNKLKDTRTSNLVPGTEAYTAERAAAHDALIAEYKKIHDYDDIPANREAILSGGLGGAGKGFALRQMNIDESKYVKIDPDDLKGLMAKHGLIPDPKKLGLGDFDPPLRPMELAGLIHEESSDLSKRIAGAALREGKNVILDNTMGSNSVFKKVTELKKNGYQVQGVFVDVSVDMSVESALARHMNGTVKGGLGGRFVDPALSAAQAPTDPKFRSANRERFESIKTELDKAVVIDNEAYRGQPSGFSSGMWESFSPEARAYVMRNLLTKSSSELIAHARSI